MAAFRRIFSMILKRARCARHIMRSCQAYNQLPGFPLFSCFFSPTVPTVTPHSLRILGDSVYLSLYTRNSQRCVKVQYSKTKR